MPRNGFLQELTLVQGRLPDVQSFRLLRKTAVAQHSQGCVVQRAGSCASLSVVSPRLGHLSCPNCGFRTMRHCRVSRACGFVVFAEWAALGERRRAHVAGESFGETPQTIHMKERPKGASCRACNLSGNYIDSIRTLHLIGGFSGKLGGRGGARSREACGAWYHLTFAEQGGRLPYANWVNGLFSSDIPCSATA